MRSARRLGISVERVLDLALWLLCAALFGSRLAFVALHLDEYYRLCAAPAAAGERSAGELLLACTRALQIWEGGYVFFGGLALAAVVGRWYTRRHRLSFWRLADLVTPPLALGHFFGRLGCFAAGCCYGKPTASRLGVAFPAGSLAHFELARAGWLAASAAATPPLHPTQLYEALAELAIFVALTLRGARKAYHGQLLVTYLVLYPAARIALELFRGDPGRGYLLQLSTPTLNRWLGLPPASAALLSLSQTTALVLITGALLLARRLRATAAPDRSRAG
jgi:phosphatidylglycerol:prolipoprotein diacylglycerol transferase